MGFPNLGSISQSRSGSLNIRKLDPYGNYEWNFLYDTPDVGWAVSIMQTSDNGYLATAGTQSYGAGYFDILILKLNSSGVFEWEKAYGGEELEMVRSMQQTSDDGYIVAGHAASFNIDLNDQLWILKLSSEGAIEWEKGYGEYVTPYEAYISIQQTYDYGYIVTCNTKVIKLYSNGEIEWMKNYVIQGEDSHRLNTIQQTLDGNYIIAGYTNGAYSFGGYDVLLMKINSQGQPLWANISGGTGDEISYSMQQTSDLGYIVAGYTTSFGNGGDDHLVMKFDESGYIDNLQDFDIDIVYLSDIQANDTTTTVTQTNANVLRIGIDGYVENFQAQAITPTVVELTWSNNLVNALGFEVERSLSYNPFITDVTYNFGPDIESYLDINLVPGTEYKYRIRAYNDDGYSAYSSSGATIPQTIPIAPTDLQITSVTSNSIELMWNDNSNNESGFRLQRAESSDFLGYIEIDVDFNLTSSVIYEVSGLLLNTEYYFRVLAYNEEGESAYSGEVSAITELDTEPPVITLIGNDPETVEVYTTYTDAGATALDNYDLIVTVTTTGTVDVNTIGDYILYYNAQDSSGNNALQVTRTVQVIDTEPPVITLIGNDPETVEVYTTYTDPGATASDNYDLIVTVTTTGTVNMNTLGDNTLYYDAQDSSDNNALQIIRTVQVVDTTPPEITLIGEEVIMIETGSAYTDEGATAEDIYDGDISTEIIIDNPVNTDTADTYTIKYNVSDSSGNAADEVTRIVVVQPQPASGELAAHWKLEGDANDSIGVNDGIADNINYIEGVKGLPKTAVELNGVSGSIQVSADGSLSLVNMGDFTIAGWAKWKSDGEGNRGRIIDKTYHYISTSDENAGKCAIRCSVGADTNSYAISLPVYDNDKWHHIAATYDSSNMRISLYVDGFEVIYAEHEDGIGAVTDDTSFDLYIGSNSSETGIFDGNICDIRLYNYVLSSSDVSDMYNNMEAIIAHYDFNNESAADSGPYANHGSEMNSPVYTDGVNGELDKAISFNSGDSQYIDIPKIISIRDNNNPILDFGGIGEFDENGLYFPNVLIDESDIKLYYSSIDTSDPLIFATGLAISSDGISFTKQGKVIDMAAGLWDARRANNVCVIKDGVNSYKMWYSGTNIDDYGKIGLATSNDGVNWTKYPGNPVFKEGKTGNFDEHGVVYPSVIKEGNTYYMWYSGYNNEMQYQGIGLAISTNGIEWKRVSTEPVLEGVGYYKGVVKKFSGYYWMLIRPSSYSDVYTAYSKDRVNWTICPTPMITEGESGQWDDNEIEDAGWWTLDGLEAKIYYSANNGADPYRIGLTTISDFIKRVRTNERFNTLPVSISVLVKTDDSGGVNKGIIGKLSVIPYNGYTLYLSEGRLKAWYGTDNSNGIFMISDTDDGGYISDGSWHHIVFIANSLGGFIYIDNELVRSKSWSGTPGITDSNAHITIGMRKDYAGMPQYFDGIVDDARIYNFELTAEDVQSIYYNNKLVAHYKLFPANYSFP